MIALIPMLFAIDRETTLNNAAAFAMHSWTGTTANETASCDSGYRSDYGPGTYIGLPYDWGGYMDIAEFDREIAAGYGAGSHSSDGVLSCTAGLDCSGFVSQVWETGHYSTSTFYEVTHDINASEVRAGDAYNDAGSHITLFAYETHAGTPVFYEASGSASQVRVNSASGWSYLSGYAPIRFDEIEDTPTATGTTTHPIEITGFPYFDQRWTAGAASDVIDSYSCASTTDESGPEMLYHFHTPSGGTLSAVVSDDEGVDIDVHVMTSASGSTCLARNDTTVSVDVPAGDVWLSLDTWVGGQEYPGPYLLSVSFTGTIGDDPVDTGGPVDSPPIDTGSPQDSEATDSESIFPPSDAPQGHLPGRLSRMDAIQGCQSGPVSLGWALVGIWAVFRGKARRQG